MTKTQTAKTLIIPPALAAAKLGVTRRTLDRWHRLGIGPARCQITRKVVGYREESLAAWLASREKQPVRGGRRG